MVAQSVGGVAWGAEGCWFKPLCGHNMEGVPFLILKSFSKVCLTPARQDGQMDGETDH